MLIKMAHISLTSRAANQFILISPKNLAQVCSARPLMTDSLLGWDSRLVFTQSSTILQSSNGSSETTSPMAKRDVDQRVQMHRLKNNFSGPWGGLRKAKNRNDMVAEFYELSKSVIDGRISVSSLENSSIFSALDEQMNYNVDILSNSQIVNVLASLIKMGVNPSTDMVKLLEHEVKFRINSISLGQVMKLAKFYNAIDTSYEQKQLTDILNNRIRSSLNNPSTTAKDLVDIYNHLISQSTQVSLVSLVEEKLLNLLTDQAQDDDDIVARYLPKIIPYDYVSLCNIFVALATAKRRPPPLLKATSAVLAKVPLPKDGISEPDVALLIDTLNSLVRLNYVNRVVVSKLVSDLTCIINLDQMDLATKCNLLRSVASLKWRSETLMKQFYDHVKTHQQGADYRLITTLVHVTAKINYKPDLDMNQFYDKFIRGSCEDSIDRHSRKWLDHVWSLAMLGVANDSHLQSILNERYIAAIENPEHKQRVQHSDAMKILNLRAIARLETQLELSCADKLEEFASIPIQRGIDMQKFASKIHEALNSIVESNEHLMHDIRTPYGFIVDCVVAMNGNLDLVPPDRDAALSDLTKLPERVITKPNGDSALNKLAIIYVLFDEVIRNFPREPIGHKRIISRILDNFGYRTVFLPEGVLNREKTSADLAKQIKELITQAVDSPDHPSKIG